MALVMSKIGEILIKILSVFLNNKSMFSGIFGSQSFNKKTFQDFYLIAADNNLFSGRPHMQTAYYNELESVREAWFERRELRKQHIPSTKIAVLFLFGFFTQLAIAFSHIGNNNATRATAARRPSPSRSISWMRYYTESALRTS